MRHKYLCCSHSTPHTHPSYSVSWQGGHLDAIARLCTMQQLHTLSLEFSSFGAYHHLNLHGAHKALTLLAGLEHTAVPASSAASSSASCGEVQGVEGCQEVSSARAGTKRNAGMLLPGCVICIVFAYK